MKFAPFPNTNRMNEGNKKKKTEQSYSNDFLGLRLIFFFHHANSLRYSLSVRGPLLLLIQFFLKSSQFTKSEPWPAFSSQYAVIRFSRLQYRLQCLPPAFLGDHVFLVFSNLDDFFLLNFLHDCTSLFQRLSSRPVL